MARAALVAVSDLGGLRLAEISQVNGQAGGGDQRFGVVLARDAAISVQGVLGQLAGFGIAAYRPERSIQKACDRPHVLMVVAEPVTPPLT